jgi:hypothetical protein
MYEMDVQLYFLVPASTVDEDARCMIYDICCVQKDMIRQDRPIASPCQKTYVDCMLSP